MGSTRSILLIPYDVIGHLCKETSVNSVITTAASLYKRPINTPWRHNITILIRPLCQRGRERRAREKQTERSREGGREKERESARSKPTLSIVLTVGSESVIALP